MARELYVSESGYYKWLKSKSKPYKHASLLADIKKVLDERPENKNNYGAKRVHLRLHQDAYNKTESYGVIYRVMKKHGLLQKSKKHPNCITKADMETQKSKNILHQDFKSNEPCTKWLSDISVVKTAEGNLYISPVLDCFDGAIVGLSMADHMRAELCIQSFENACKSYKARNMVFHSDRGSQYTSNKFRHILAEYGATQSMSGTGRCYDNARMESFFATLKKEKLYKINCENLPMDTVKSIIFRWIFTYYNRHRVYSANVGGYPPLVKREMYGNKSFNMAA